MLIIDLSQNIEKDEEKDFGFWINSQESLDEM